MPAASPAEYATPHPIRLTVSDDLARNRLTVFFRLLLVIPHGIWIGLWGIAALFAALATWFAILMQGIAPEGLHNFLARYVKYVTQVYAYVYLAANPYPPFDGRPGYPVDVDVDPPRRQGRWGVAFRLILALPALIFGSTLAGSPTWSSYERRGGGVSGSALGSGGGLLIAVAFLGWFAILARGRMPRGLRDAAAYALSYAAQLWAYLLLLTDRYPDSDPERALGELPARSDPISLDVGGELRRSRLTVFFRLPLTFPHVVWLVLWGILALAAAIANWLATLLIGRSPAPLHRFLSRYARYLVHVYAFLYLIGNPFPGFAGAEGSYPVDLSIAPPQRQYRAKVAFRLLLAVPAFIVSSVYGAVMAVAALLGWFASLVTGSMPRGLRNAGALALRYSAQVNGYLFLLTDSYPYSGPCVPAVEQAAAERLAAPLLPEPS
jgi:Domain of unknown function (DUF4389)